MHKYNLDEIIEVRSDLTPGIDFGTYNYKDKEYIPGEHFVVTGLSGGRELEYHLSTLDGAYYKIILPERLIKCSVGIGNSTLISNFPTEKIPLSGWCLAPSKRVLKALNDQFGKMHRSGCGASGVAWSAGAIWKIEGMSSFAKVQNDFLEAIYFPNLTVGLNTLTGIDYSRFYSDGTSSIANNQVSKIKEYTQERTPMQNWDFKGQAFFKPEVKDPNDYSLQEPMLMKKVDKKRKLIIS
jgi:hypothetical protein